MNLLSKIWSLIYLQLLLKPATICALKYDGIYHCKLVSKFDAFIYPSNSNSGKHSNIIIPELKLICPICLCLCLLPYFLFLTGTPIQSCGRGIFSIWKCFHADTSSITWSKFSPICTIHPSSCFIGNSSFDFQQHLYAVTIIA